MSQFQEKTQIIRFEQLSRDIVRLTLDSPDIASRAKPGQFVMVKAGRERDPLLRRPFSISQTSNGRHFQILFKVVGSGTSILAHYRVGEYLSVLGPLGNGYQVNCDGHNCLVGGGVGIAPLLFLGKWLVRVCPEKPPLVVIGARTAAELSPLVKDFEEIGLRVHTATDDGSLGHQGFVLDVLKTINLDNSCRMHVCGPYPMMAAIHLFCKEKELSCQVSMETHMACGMGACLGCIVPARAGVYAHACSDGPVFDAKELIWEVK